MTSIRALLDHHWPPNSYRLLLIMAIAASGVFRFLTPALAEGTAAGTDIINRATATYSDGTTNFNATSNTVTIKVEEVRGLTVIDAGFSDTNGGSIATGDIVTFDFLITNTGNADAYVFIPSLTALNLSAQGGVIASVDIVRANGTAITPVSVPSAGAITSLLSLPNGGVVSADGSLTVRVTMAVTALTASSPISVQFGNTADNNIAPATGAQNQQNIRDDSDGASALNDVRTIDANGTLSPVNGEREAAAFHQEFFATSPRSLAQVTLLLDSVLTPGGNASSAVDDTIAYSLDFRVENNSQPGYPAGSLEGTPIQLDTGAGPQTVERVLIATTIPPSTVWNGITPTVPNSNWTPVYAIDSAATGTENPLNIVWSTTPPPVGAVARIGFIYDAAVNGALPPGTVLNNFDFGVITNGLPPTGGTVANIGQVFGQTNGDPANNLVYDESGDQDPNNYDDGVFPPNPVVSDFVANPQTGAADPNDPSTGNNQGVGPNGESNVVTVTAIPPTTSALLNGPNSVPNASGPTNDQDDFTNAAATVDVVGVQGSLTNPAPVIITNTLSNSATTNLDTVTLLPFAPDSARALTGGVFGMDRDSDTSLNDEIPDGTLVTIALGGQSATYTYSGGAYTLTNGSPVVVGQLLPNATANYSVTIDLPPGTPQLQGYTVPILAFVDNNASTDFNSATETVYNLTNNRVYPGFVRLVKEARLLDANGNQLQPFGQNPAFRAQPGQIIEYRVSYQNISEAQPPTGGGNVLLVGNNLVITEDGNDGTNTWALITQHQLGTAISRGTIAFFNAATALGSTDPASNTVVTRYINTVPSIPPQGTGSLTFKRQVD